MTQDADYHCVAPAEPFQSESKEGQSPYFGNLAYAHHGRSPVARNADAEMFGGGCQKPFGPKEKQLMNGRVEESHNEEYENVGNTKQLYRFEPGKLLTGRRSRFGW